MGSKTVGWSILVMGISLATVIILWVWIGHIGPTYSREILIFQQKTLRRALWPATSACHYRS